MDVDLALLADAATIDAAGKLNILGVFDRIAVSSFPVQHGRIALVLRFVAGMDEAGRHTVQISLKDPRGTERVRLDGEMTLGPGPASAGGRIRVPHVLNLDGLVFPEPGRYTFDVAVDGHHQVSLPLVVGRPEGREA